MMKTAGDAVQAQRDLGATTAPGGIARSKTRQAEAGVFDELTRIDQANKTMYGNGSFSATSSNNGVKNLKALKNMSQDVQNLIENRPMQSFSKKMELEDCNRFLSFNLKMRKPIFKNHTKTNASIMRSEIRCKKKEEMSQQDSANLSYLDKISVKSNPMERSKRTGPMQALNQLMK